MKKTFSLFLMIGLSQLFFGCAKDQSATTAKTETVQVATATTDSAKNAALKQAMAVGCKFPTHFRAYPDPMGYTLIGTFGAQSVALTKGTVWRAGSFTLNFQPDGNLVIYNGNGEAIWDCPKAWTKNPSFILQPDMNFVAYANNNPNTPVWASGTQDFYCNGKMALNTKLILTALGDLEVVADGINIYGLRSTCVLASTESSNGKKLGKDMVKYASNDNLYNVNLDRGVSF